MSAEILQAVVWQRRGLGNVPGVLVFADQKLSFTTEEGCLFHVPLGDVMNLRWPWYSMNAAFKATINGKKYYLSFARPNGAAAAVPFSATSAALGETLGGAVSAVQIVNLTGSIFKAIKVGKQWKAAMARQMGS